MVAIRCGTSIHLLLGLGAVLAWTIAPRICRAQTVTATPIFSFADDGSGGAAPKGGLVVDTSGRLYGTTSGGGSAGGGVVYRLTPPAAGQTQWTEQVLFNFDGANGSQPSGGLNLDAAGNVYGTTASGGAMTGGEVYKLTNAVGWPLTVLHSFDAVGLNPGGFYPDGNMVFGPGGLLYGTTPIYSYGNGGYKGTDFSVSPQGDAIEYRTINQFGKNGLGWGPLGMVPVPGTPDLAGVTAGRGAHGTVYALQATGSGGGTASTIWTFGSGTDVDWPVTPPIIGYGKLAGSAFGCALAGGTGNGTGMPRGGFYRITANGAGNYAESVIFSFPDLVPPYATSDYNCWLGQADASGTLYGISTVEDVPYQNAFLEFTPPASVGEPWGEKVLLYFSTANAWPAQYPWVQIGGSYFIAFTQGGGSSGNGVVLQLTVTP